MEINIFRIESQVENKFRFKIEDQAENKFRFKNKIFKNLVIVPGVNRSQIVIKVISLLKMFHNLIKNRKRQGD
jgi:hypothetical protein